MPPESRTASASLCVNQRMNFALEILLLRGQFLLQTELCRDTYFEQVASADAAVRQLWCKLHDAPEAGRGCLAVQFDTTVIRWNIKKVLWQEVALASTLCCQLIRTNSP